MEKLPKLKKTKKEMTSELKKIKEPMPSVVKSPDPVLRGKEMDLSKDYKENLQDKFIRTGSAADAEAVSSENKKKLLKAIEKMRLPKRKK